MASPGFAVLAHQGKEVWVVDELMRFIATGRETGGAYMLTESMELPNGGPPTHIHEREDEAFWVTDGELVVIVGGERHTVPTGGYIFLPRAVPHRFLNAGTSPVRFLTLATPAGLEGFFQEVGVPGTEVDAPPLGDPKHIAMIHEAAPRYGIELIFDDDPEG